MCLPAMTLKFDLENIVYASEVEMDNANYLINFILRPTFLKNGTFDVAVLILFTFSLLSEKGGYVRKWRELTQIEAPYFIVAHQIKAYIISNLIVDVISLSI